MTWFDIVKDAKKDAEEFYTQFKEMIFKQIKNSLEELDKEEERYKSNIKTNELVAANMSQIEMEIIQPILDVRRQMAFQALNEIYGTRLILEQQAKDIANVFSQMDGVPIESKLVVFRDNMAEIEGLDGKPLIDIDALDKLIHRLGFEGKGME